MALDDIPHPFLTPHIVAVEDIFLRRCMTELDLLKQEQAVAPQSVALAGFAMFCAGCLQAGSDPTEIYRELVNLDG